MKITKIEVFPVAIPYPEPYKTASRAKPAQADVIIKMHTDEGIIGLGDAIARPYNGCTHAVTTAVLVNELGPAVVGQDPLQIERLIVDRLGGMDCPWLNALAAIDLALWDIAGKYYKKPVYELLGGAARRTITLARSVPIKSPQEMAERAVALVQKGYKMITVKIGLDPEEDLRRVRAVKEAVGDAVPVEVDGNEGYALDDAIKYLKQMDPFIANCEQPLARWDLHGAAEVARVMDAALIADQAILTARDVALIAQMRAADVICLKPNVIGGITLARKAFATAEAHGLPCSMGSGHPLGIGTAAIHHFTAAHPSIKLPIGYGSPLERLSDDVIANPLEVKDGTIELWDGPGLGVELDEDKLKKYASKITIEYDKPVTVAVNRPKPWLTGV
jgi:L-alanine-DL-glutamate epimerase-like enolase superfamily enzyme